MDACTNIARSTLARVLLNTQVMTMVNVMAVRVNRVMPTMPPPPDEAAQEGTRNSGRCHSARKTPRMSDASSGPCSRSMRGSAKPRQPAYLLEQRSSKYCHKHEGGEVANQVGRTSEGPEFWQVPRVDYRA